MRTYISQPRGHLLQVNHVFETAPANKLIKYKTVKFESGFAKKTQYMGPPSEAYDKAWEDLYNCKPSYMYPRRVFVSLY